MKPKEGVEITPHAIFIDYQTKSGADLSPEIYPRPNGEVYMCGLSENVEIPEDPSTVLPRDGICEKLFKMANNISSKLGESELDKKQACFLPLSGDNLPMIGKLPGIEGAYVCAGHTCWGILNSPASAASLVELIVDGNSSTVDLTPFDPSRFVEDDEVLHNVMKKI